MASLSKEEKEGASAKAKSLAVFHHVKYSALEPSCSRSISLPSLSSALHESTRKLHEPEQYSSGVTVSARAAAPRSLLLTAASLLLFYVLSISSSLANKFVLGRSYLDFSYPLLATALSTLVHAALSGFILWIGYARPRSSPPCSAGLGSQKYFTWLPMHRQDYLRKAIPCGLAAAFDIGISNTSLRFVTLSLYTLVKSSSPIFSLLFSFVFGLERPRLFLILIMLAIAAGVFLSAAPLAAAADAESAQMGRASVDGSLIVLAASVFGGLRWTLTQLLLTRPPKLISTSVCELAPNDAELSARLVDSKDDGLPGHRLYFFSPLLAIYQVSPIVSLACLILSALVENWPSFSASPFFASPSRLAMTGLILAACSLLTFGLILCEFIFMSATSVLTLSVASMFKEILVIFFSVLIFGDYLSWLNYMGLAISLLGIAAYQYYRYHSLCAKPTPLLLLHTSAPSHSQRMGSS